MSRSGLADLLAFKLPVPVLGLICMVSASAQTDEGAGGGESAASRASARPSATLVIRARKSIEQRFFAAGSLVTVDRQDIEQMGAQSVGDVLRQLPGVQVNANGNGNLDIRMRGMDSSATQVLIDGEKASGNQAGQLSLDQLPADLIERVEVLRAPSAEHAGASGGTLNIVLRQPSQASETNVRITQQHVWGQNAAQNFFSKTGPIRLLRHDIDVKKDSNKPNKNHKNNSTDETFVADTASTIVERQPWTYFVTGGINERLTGSDVQRTTQGQGSSTSFDENSRNRTQEWFLIPRLNGRLSATDQLGVSGRFWGTQANGQYVSNALGNLQGNSTTQSATQNLTQSLTQRSMAQLRSDWGHRFADSRLDSFVSAQRAGDTLARQRWLGPAGDVGNSSARFNDDRVDRSLTVSSKLTGTSDPLLWMLGGEWEERRLQVNSVQDTSPTQLAAQTRRAVVWGQNEWAFETLGFKRREGAEGAEGGVGTTLTAGLRMEHYASTGGELTGASNRYQRLFWQPSLHARTPLSDRLQIRFNLARISRNPAVLDLIDRRTPSLGPNSPTNPDWAGNPSLRPETTLTFDGGLERKLGDQGTLGLNAFVRQLNDVIARRVSVNVGVKDSGVGTSLWTQRPENAGNAQAWGLEGDIKAPAPLPPFMGSGWIASANVSLLQSRMTSGDSAGQRIPGQARYLANVNLARSQPSGTGWHGGVGLYLQGAADLKTSLNATGREAAYASVDTHVGQQIQGLGYWRLTVYNLTNSKRLRERVDIDSAGRALVEQSTLRWTPRVFLSVGIRF